GGRIASLPIERRGGLEFLLEVVTINGAPASGKALVRLPSVEPLDLGERVLVTGRLSLPPPPSFPSAPSWRGYLQSIGVRSIVRAVGLREESPASAPLHLVSAFHRRMLASFRAA